MSFLILSVFLKIVMMFSEMDRKVIIIPTYNEKENIEKIIRAIFSLEGEYHIIIIEDGSPDGTGMIVKTLQKEFPERLFMIERAGKQGLGTAYIAGFKWAPRMFRGFTEPVPKKGRTWPSAPGTATVSAS